MRVWGFKRFYEAVPGIDRIFTRSDFKKFLSHPDYVVITLPSTPDTLHLIDDDTLRAMKNSAVLINIGRGSVVSENALVQALEEGRIRGAVLDVFEEEPEVPQALMDLPNAVLLPHIGSASIETRDKMAVMAARSLIDVLAGKDAEFRVM